MAQKKIQQLQPRPIPLAEDTYKDHGKAKSSAKGFQIVNIWLCVYQQMKLEVGVRKKGEWK